MHLPDGLLAGPVWLGLDIVALPAVGYAARRAQREMQDARVPLLGVMGAFVFAAQMINFPAGPGTSAHLVGAAVLAATLGPAAASTVMAAVLVVQALVFQDGGVLALGANVFNMAIAGVLAAWLPYRLWGGQFRRAALFAGAALSVLTAGMLTIAELRISGIAIPGAALALSAGVFAIAAAIEGAITVAIAAALERLSPKTAMRGPAAPPRATAVFAFSAFLLAGGGVAFASAWPDAVEKLAADLGLGARAQALFTTPLSNYQARYLTGEWLPKAAAGLAGVALLLAVFIGLERLAARRRSA